MKLTTLTLLALLPVLANAQLVPTNVALFKPAAGDTAFGAPPSRGNDGTDGAQDAGNWTHADYPASAVPYPGEFDLAPNPFWQVDLQGSFDLTHIEIVDRVDCCDPNRLNLSTITLFDDTMTQIGDPVIVDGLFPASFADEATLTFDNNGLGWSNVAHIRIDGDEFNQYFQFSEFRAFSDQEPGLPNAALGRVVTASAATWVGQPPSNITDGDLNTQSHPLADFDTLGFTYTIDLDQTYTLESLLIYNRRQGNCCPERLTNYRVSLHDDDGTGAPGPAVWSADIRTDFSDSGVGGIDTLTADLNPTGTFAGQFIVVENLSDDPYNPQIAEIEALTTDEVIPPPPPPEPEVNLATGKPIDLYDHTGFPVPTWNGFPATNLIDGLPETISHPADAFSLDYYYEVDLLEDTVIGRIEITGRGFRDGCCPERLENARIIVINDAGTEVYNQIFPGQIIDTETLDFNAAPITGRFIRVVHTEEFFDYGPQLGELAIWPPGGDPPATTDLAITNITIIDLATGQFELTWNSEPDAIYSIWADDDLVGPWINVTDFARPNPDGNTTTLTITDSIGAGSPVRYFYISKN